MHRHRFLPQDGVRVQLFLHELRAADDGVQPFVDLFPPPERRLRKADGALGRRAVDALIPDAGRELPAEAVLTDLSVHPTAHMIRADQLVVVGRVEDAAGVSDLLPPFVCLKEDAGRQLIVEIVEMDNIRSKIIQHQPQLLPGLGRINGLERVCKLRQLAAAVEIHAAGVGIHPVAHTPALMLHPEILHLMAHPFQLLSQLEHIGLGSAVGVKEFVDHQNFHCRTSHCIFTKAYSALLHCTHIPKSLS